MTSFYSFTTLYSNFESLPKFIGDIFDLIEKYSELPTEFKSGVIFIMTVLFLFILTVGIGFIIRNLSIQAFDIKLHHKNEQSRLHVSKFVSKLILSTIFLIYLQATLAILSSEIEFIKLIYLAVIGLLIIFEVLFALNIILHEILVTFNANLRQSRYGTITNKSKDFAIGSLVLLNIFVSSFILSSIFKSGSNFDSMDLLLSFLFTLLISIIVLTYLLSKNKKMRFVYKGSSDTMPKYQLYLDYVINENTILLHNEDQTIYVIKEDKGGCTKYEIFEKS